MYKLRRKLFSQNFLHNRKLVAKLLGRSSIGKHDVVLEIGPGKGIITELLAKQAQHVLAIEIDQVWYRYLQTKFQLANNVTLYNADVLNFRLPGLPYKVFANIPFSIEGKIIRKLIDAKNPPDDCYLVMIKEVAYRLAAPYKENQFSITHKPWFDFSVSHHFNQTDFSPVPAVKIVMLQFTKRNKPLLPWKERQRFRTFVQIGFGHGQSTFHNLSRKFGHKRVLSICILAGVKKHTKPSFITVEQWITLYKTLAC